MRFPHPSAVSVCDVLLIEDMRREKEEGDCIELVDVPHECGEMQKKVKTYIVIYNYRNYERLPVE